MVMSSRSTRISGSLDWRSLVVEQGAAEGGQYEDGEDIAAEGPSMTWSLMVL